MTTGAAVPGTPLPPVPERPIGELRSFLISSEVGMFDMLADDMLEHAVGRSTASLAMELTESSTLSADLVRRVLRVTHPEDAHCLPADALRLAAAVQSEHGVDLAHHAVASGVVSAAHGLHVFHTGHPAGAAITTSQRLASCAAVAAFVIHFAATPEIVSSGMAAGILWRSVTNRWLRDLLQARPSEVGRTIVYLSERGIRPNNRQEVEQLQAWLDEEPSTLAVGWL